jgi:hypothetical protein
VHLPNLPIKEGALSERNPQLPAPLSLALEGVMLSTRPSFPRHRGSPDLAEGGTAVTIETQIDRLTRAVEDFHGEVASLAQGRLQQKLDGWSPRDIVAHLIGWNRYVIRGSRQIRKGELPFYDVDSGANYSKINAALVREYPSTDRQELLDELRASARELEEFLRSLDPGEWSHDYGVRNEGSAVTIENTVDELIEDYDHHRRQIQEWARRF